MACPPPAHDWGMTAMYGLLLLAIGLTAGKLWGEKTGPPGDE